MKNLKPSRRHGRFRSAGKPMNSALSHKLPLASPQFATREAPPTVSALSGIASKHEMSIRMDRGSEFVSRDLNLWAHWPRVTSSRRLMVSCLCVGTALEVMGRERLLFRPRAGAGSGAESLRNLLLFGSESVALVRRSARFNQAWGAACFKRLNNHLLRLPATPLRWRSNTATG